MNYRIWSFLIVSVVAASAALAVADTKSDAIKKKIAPAKSKKKAAGEAQIVLEPDPDQGRPALRPPMQDRPDRKGCPFLTRLSRSQEPRFRILDPQSPHFPAVRQIRLDWNGKDDQE